MGWAVAIALVDTCGNEIWTQHTGADLFC
jgi:hypothetical protein